MEFNQQDSKHNMSFCIHCLFLRSSIRCTPHNFAKCLHRMSALPAKPSLRHSVSEWASNNRHLSNTAQQERNASNVIRQEGRSLRNEANCKVDSCL